MYVKGRITLDSDRETAETVWISLESDVWCLKSDVSYRTFGVPQSLLDIGDEEK